MIDKPKSIETIYNGYRFRSRLEARWAVLFDAMGIEYEYEPQGFDLGDGIYYLPDFLLHGVKGRNDGFEKDNNSVWVEVKGVNNYHDISSEDLTKIERFSKYYPLYLVGNIPNPKLNIRNPRLSVHCSNVMHDIGNDASDLFSCVYIDGDQFGLALCIDTSGAPSLIDANCNQRYMPDDEATDRAYRIARMARFEHGETPIKGGASF